MNVGDNVVLRGTIKGVTYGEYGFPHYLVTLPNGCETEFPKPYIEDLQQLDEPEKVQIPQFVADWLSNLKSGLFGLNYDSVSSEIYDWVYDTEDNLGKLHLAFVYGYEVEEVKD